MKKDRFVLAAALMAPAFVALLAPRLGIGSVPGTALASGSESALAPAAPMIALAKPSKEQLAALDRVTQIGEAGGVGSPFLEPVEDHVAPLEVVDNGPDWTDRLARQFNLTSVFGSARGDAAAINGKFYFNGSRVADGVVIESIDLASRSVIVVTEDAGRYRLGIAARRDEPTVVTRVKD